MGGINETSMDSDDSSLDLEYLRQHPSAALPPSPLSPNAYGRPRAPTPSLSSSPSSIPLIPLYPSDSPISDSPSFSQHQNSSFHSSMPLPDPSQYPDPYPFRPPHHLANLPALSSAASSSTRSSAYTSSRRSTMASGDYGHVHVASGDDDAVGVGITSDAVVQLLTNDPNSSSSAARGIHSRAPIDQSRWSESYSASIRSRSSSLGANLSNSGHDNVPQKLQQKPSYDMGWQTVDEKDEVAMSEEETDDDHHLGEEEEDEEKEKEEERTSAAVIADEGRGLIVHGENLPIAQLHVQPGTTHLLIGSSGTPNAMPAFLTSSLPYIGTTLLALDISANFLGALPPVLAICENLEELNIAYNPLRVLPVFLADLTNLRVLIADSTGISTLPDTLVDLDRLHTVSIRRNKLHALPSWLCLLPALQTLCIDGNPFQGPWKALVEPLLAKIPTSPMYPPSTPMLPLLSSSTHSSVEAEMDGTDIEELSDSAPPSTHADRQSQSLEEEEDHTITPERAPFLSRSATASTTEVVPIPPLPRGLTRTRTTPNRAHFNQSRGVKSGLPSSDSRKQKIPSSSKPTEDFGYFGDRELRKMKSAGDLRQGKSVTTSIELGLSPPSVQPLGIYPTSLSSSNLLNISPPPPERPGLNKRFASVGPASGSPSRPAANGLRPHLTRSLWDNISENADGPSSYISNRVSVTPSNAPFPPHKPGTQKDTQDGKYTVRARSSKEGKEKGSRWGFLKKMSMGKMRVDPPSTQSRVGSVNRPYTSNGLSLPTATLPSSSSTSGSERLSRSPQIDMRFSTSGILDGVIPNLTTPPSPPQTERDTPQDMLKSPGVISPSNLLAPPSLPRTAKRRSFLPIEAPGSLSLIIPIPETSAFVPGLTALNDGEDVDGRGTTPSPIDSEQYLRREEERAREAYMRALRSVMAYLKDMNDLGLSQQSNPMSMYGATTDDISVTRSRRPTVVDGPREVSMVLSSSTAASLSDSAGQLRSMESMAGLRSGSSTQTLSVATTDSSGSSEERKFKDDKGKRAMVVREIVATERTYVKGLQELVDIYIKPACVPVNILSGVGSSKDTVVPASERKIVFGGIEALFSFHKDNFLPALEIAAAPLMTSSAEQQVADADGQLSLNVVKAVGSMFLKHAAFMRMYSSYINNFDNSVQRVKYWSADRTLPGNASPGTAMSPSSSTVQLVGLGLSMSAITNPGVASEGSPVSGVPNLSMSQRKRIKSYLKRCRMNPRHSQLNLEGYLLLPVQRIPRYRLLLEELLRSTPPTYEYMDDPLDRALTEISSLANNMNEGKRESESRRKLVQWQSRIRGKFPSPLVQPHRRLIMDGPLLLTRVVRKAMVSFEAINPQGDASTVQVDCLAPELTPRPLVGILCNDLLVLCRDPSEGQDPASCVDLWAVLRMQTLPQPASIVHGNALRLVDNKAILYFDAPSPSDALNWYRAINLHIPASKT